MISRTVSVPPFPRSSCLQSELQHYYDAVRDTGDARAVPTYLVSGEVPALVSSHPETQQSDSAMDLDLEFEEDREEMDVVYQSKVLLVDARALDGTLSVVHTNGFTLILTFCIEAKSQFSRIHSVHIYSLSPSRLGVRACAFSTRF